MFELTKKKKIAAVTVAVFAIGGTAMAYWTTSGSGTGSAATADGVQAVTVVQTTPTGELAPGVAPVTLSGTFTNPNEGPVYITTLSVTEIVVTKADGVTGTCDSTDYTLAGSPLAIGGEALANDTTTWSGITLAFNNKVSNQDACKGATVTLTYSTS